MHQLFFVYTEKANDLTRLIQQVYTEKKQHAEKAPGQNTQVNNLALDPSSYSLQQSSTAGDGGFQNCTHDLISHEDKGDITNQQDIIIRKTKKTNKDNSNNYDRLALVKRAHVNINMGGQVNSVDNVNDKRNSIEISESEIALRLENDMSVNKMTSEILESCIQCMEDEQQDQLAFCWIWDFAGKKDFYIAHQVFLSPCAVYLLVTDSLELNTSSQSMRDTENTANKILNIKAVSCNVN